VATDSPSAGANRGLCNTPRNYYTKNLFKKIFSPGKVPAHIHQGGQGLRTLFCHCYNFRERQLDSAMGWKEGDAKKGATLFKVSIPSLSSYVPSRDHVVLTMIHRLDAPNAMLSVTIWAPRESKARSKLCHVHPFLRLQWIGLIPRHQSARYCRSTHWFCTRLQLH